MNGKQTPGRWQTTFPSLLGAGSGMLIMVISYAAGASWTAVALRTIVATVCMFGLGKLAGAVIKEVWQVPEDNDLWAVPLDDLPVEQPDLGRNFDVRLEQEEGTNGQIDPNLQQNLMDDPERLADLAQKMGAGS